MAEFNYIREDQRVYARVFVDGNPTDKFVLVTSHPSISQAKHWSRMQPAGTVRRYQSLERERGRQYMRSLFQ